MWIRSFSGDGFRNLSRVKLEFSPRVNVLIGQNGQGKTNLLEALYLLGGFRSFRGSKSRELITTGREAAKIGAEIEAHGVVRSVELVLRHGAKNYLIDGKAPGSLSEWLGQLVLVTFSPDDLFLVKGEPELRRRFLDRVIFFVEPEHLANVMQYQRALKTRNALLKDGMFGRDLMLLDVFDATLARAGARVRVARKRWCKELSEIVSTRVQALTGGSHQGWLHDDSEVECEDEQTYLDTLVSKREDDVRRRLTRWGVHHDDVKVVFSGKDARRFASQGEQRAMTLAMKLAETELLRLQRKVDPVLLLDDVAGELDQERNAFLFNALTHHQGQVFVAGTELPEVLRDSIVKNGAESRRVFEVLSGEIREKN